MKFTESWLRELIDFPVSINDLAGQLTMAGLEVDAVTPCSPGFSDVIIARVEKVEPHPESNKLKVCLLDTGIVTRCSVVCGAENVQTGRCYPLARPGAVLPGNKSIKTATIHGLISEGMLCSEKDLALSEDDAGIFELSDDAIPGTKLDDYLVLNDTLIEVSLTPNRGDCLGMTGLAREVAVLNKIKYRPALVKPIISMLPATRKIILEAAAACPRYCGRIIHEVDLTRKLPVTIAERLRRYAIRSINPVVDLANYVMLETGQPMHVFDNDTLQGTIRVRFAREGESLVLLDGVTRGLSANTLVIADETGPIAMAGIMGGLPTAVTSKTRSIFIESAWFDPGAIMGRARQYSLHTDASHRYERGVDPALSPIAIERLSELILGVCKGNAGPVHHVANEDVLPGTKSIRLRSSRVRRLLGTKIPDKRITTLLEQLGFGVVKDSNARGEWQITVPSYRFDVGVEADLIEEIARIHGYQNITGTSPLVKMRMKAPDSHTTGVQVMAEILIARGYLESISYSFIDPAIQKIFGGDTEPVTLLNPISAEMAEMRQSLWPGLVQSLLHNIKRQQSSVRLFETGKIYRGKHGSEEIRVIGGALYGNNNEKQWDVDITLFDFYDMKSDVEALLAAQLNNLPIEFSKIQHPALHPGQSAQILSNGTELGVMGMLHPSLIKHFGMSNSAYLFQLEIGKISPKNTVKFTKISKYPSIRRDISIIVDNDIVASDLLDSIKTTVPETLTNLELFDVYRGEGIDSGKKSLALGLTFQRSSSTLTDEEADVAISVILETLRKQFGAILRE